MGALYAVAYLSDVFARADDHESLDFKRSRWFTRGWCLQELVAPFNLLFCNRDWTLMGSKIGLVSQIEEVTGIDRHYLQSPRSIFQASVAQSMSWASKRETTRTEDIAYCLMGIFDINMPLLYGEGYKAFLRLQREIIEQSDDESIFAWTATSPADAVELDPNIRQWCVLSNRPSDFERSRNVRRTNDSASQYGISNRGIRFETIVRHIDHISQSQEALHLVDLVVIQLGCARGDIAHWSKPEIGGGEIANASPCMLALTKMVWSDRWYRVHPGSLDLSTLRDVILEGTEMRRGIVENKVLYLGADMTEFIEPSSWSLGPVSVTENRLWRHLFPDS